MKTKQQGRAKKASRKRAAPGLTNPPVQRPVGPYLSPQGMPLRPLCFDPVILQSVLDGTKNKTDAVFEREILDRAKILTPTASTKEKVNELTEQIVSALNKEKEEKTLTDVTINQIVKVGSFMTDTALNTSNKSDIVLQLATLPSFETVSAISKRVIESMKTDNFKEVVQAVSHDYGCCFMTPNAQVRLLVTIIPDIHGSLEPDLHLNSKKMIVNLSAIDHYEWFKSIASRNDNDFILELRSLIRCLKDARNRFFDLQPISIWTIQYLAFYCLVNTENGTKVNLGTAFRRFFEIISSGLLFTTNRMMKDPTSQACIGWDLTNQQRDSVTMGAQTLIRVFATGNDGYRAILGTHPSSKKEDLTQTRSSWNNIIVQPLVDAYKEGCLDPYIKEDQKEEEQVITI